METDPVIKDNKDIQEEGKEENITKQEEEETRNMLDDEKEDKETKEGNEVKEIEEVKEQTRNRPVEEGMEDEDMTTKDREENKEKEMEEEDTAKATKQDIEKEAKAKAKKLKKEVEKAEESKLDTGKKARTEGKESDRKEVEEKGPKTPVSLLSDRPVRERKPVERLVASIEKDSGRKFQIKKGHGTALKDIPNVAYKLSKRKVGDDTLKLLHTILFGRIAKVAQVKMNISQFSGIVSNENEEKKKVKIKEKLDKCLKEKLVEFCDVLDIPIAKADGRKDIVVKLVDFLMAPEAMTTELVADKEQLSKGEKLKRTAKGSGLEYGGSPSKHSAKSHTKKKDEEENEQNDDGESKDAHEQKAEQKEEKEEDVNGVPEKSKNEVSDPFETEEENDDMDEDYSEDEKLKKKCRSRKPYSKKESSAKTKAKKTTTPKKSSAPTKSSSKRRKIDDRSDATPKTLLRKEKTDNGKGKEKEKEKASTPKQLTSKEKSGGKVVRDKDKLKEEKLKPSDVILRKAIRKILTEVDFNKATFTDVLKQLAVKYKSDFTPRKSSIKQMIKEEITKLAEETDDDDHFEEDKEEAKVEDKERIPSTEDVIA